MVEEAKKSNRVVQVGIQRRLPLLPQAAERCWGGLGKVSVAKSYHVLNESPMGIGRPRPVRRPTALDWERWLGPAPRVPYSSSRSFYNSAGLDYSGGHSRTWNPLPRSNPWSLGRTAARSVDGGRRKSASTTTEKFPDSWSGLMYEGGTMATFSQYNLTGAPSNSKGASSSSRHSGGALLGYGGFEVVPEQVRLHPVPARARSTATRPKEPRRGSRRSRCREGLRMLTTRATFLTA